MTPPVPPSPHAPPHAASAPSHTDCGTPVLRSTGSGAAAGEASGACLNAHEAAAFLRLNEKKLYELANKREIPAARVGGKWLFPRTLLEEWLLEQAHGGALTDRLLIT
ncbi:MAG: helix-turn-helix domain-containing protein, partial [Thauera sp.]|nr:helix-turn-helix domain-containing protein [Thauera sp.]